MKSAAAGVWETAGVAAEAPRGGDGRAGGWGDGSGSGQGEAGRPSSPRQRRQQRPQGGAVELPPLSLSLRSTVKSSRQVAFS